MTFDERVTAYWRARGITEESATRIARFVADGATLLDYLFGAPIWADVIRPDRCPVSVSAIHLGG